MGWAAPITSGMTGLIHVAGVIDFDEAEMLIDSGVEYLGFPLVLGYHREDLSVGEAASIVDKLRDRATFFLITYLDTAPTIIDLCRRLDISTVQLHAATDLAELKSLRKAWSGLHIIKSLVVREDNLHALIDEVKCFAPWVDAFITDTFDPATGATGATGKTHDWAVSRCLVSLSPKPVILAGGLNADNVRAAITTVRPAGVDAHTGIEGRDGRKKHDLTKRFIAEARAGFAGEK
jgi:phosphoribosylanthranilate isomerase